MPRRKSYYSIGFMLACIAAGEHSMGCAQTPGPSLLPPPTFRLTSAILDETLPPADTAALDGPRELFSPLLWTRTAASALLLFNPRQNEAWADAAEIHPIPSRDLPGQPLRVLDDAVTLLKKEAALLDAPPGARKSRLLMFRMPSGFLATPMGLESDDEMSAGADDPASKSAGDDDGSSIQVTLGRHIPYLEMFRRGDPGGVGYYRLHSQVQIFDSGSSSMCLGLQAYTPVGQGCGEVLSGPTTLIPAMSCFQEIHDGTALHAFIGGKPVTADARWREQLCSGFCCGLAVQQPVLTTWNAEQGLFVFVQTLGQCRPDSLRGDVKATSWAFIPGMQWRMNSCCWMSMGISRYNFLTCAWQY